MPEVMTLRMQEGHSSESVFPLSQQLMTFQLQDIQQLWRWKVGAMVHYLIKLLTQLQVLIQI